MKFSIDCKTVSSFAGRSKIQARSPNGRNGRADTQYLFHFLVKYSRRGVFELRKLNRYIYKYISVQFT